MFSTLKVFRTHEKQCIPDLHGACLPANFRGRLRVTGQPPAAVAASLEALCPTRAITASPLSIDLGRCVGCGECTLQAPDHVAFTNDYRLATNCREALVVDAHTPDMIAFDPARVRREIRRTFGPALKLRQVSAGGDNSDEMELNASMNVNFDFSRFGIDFVASPRHADGVVLTGPITENMAYALEICYHSMPAPKFLILCGTSAVSGGLFAGAPAIDRSFLDRFEPDLYIPGTPVHPLTFIDGVLTLIGRYDRESCPR